MRTHWFAFLALVSLLGFPTKAFAHALATDYALAAANRLKIEAIFSTGEPFVEAKVVVYAPNDPSTPWMEGTTDEEGNFAFEPDPALPGDWVVEIGEYGHMDILTVPATERGIELDAISQVSPNNRNPLAIAVGAMVIAGSVGTTVLLSRRKMLS
ncbi:MAG: carboxypeptidase regulatory-like domain-containing protein [Cyanobacteriota bacterium]|nr:carboxypeptidase regulatory-like domain-containing protein [Cyanobacteriota bacterium]